MNLKLLVVCFEITMLVVTFLPIRDYCEDMNYSEVLTTFVILFLLNLIVFGLYLIISQIMHIIQ